MRSFWESIKCYQNFQTLNRTSDTPNCNRINLFVYPKWRVNLVQKRYMKICVDPSLIYEIV